MQNSSPTPPFANGAASDARRLALVLCRILHHSPPHFAATRRRITLLLLQQQQQPTAVAAV